MLTKSQIEQYFLAEKQEAVVFMLLGIAAILAAACAWWIIKTPWAKGAVAPLLLVGLLHGIVGYTVFQRADADRKRVAYALDLNPSELRDHELPRMNTVMKNFVIYRYVEIGLLILGLGLIVWFQPGKAQFWFGFGCALALEGAISLGADYFAEKRGRAYQQALTEQVASFY